MKNNLYKTKKKGQVMILTVLFFLAIGLIVVFAVSSTVVKDILNQRNLLYGKVSYYVSEAALEDTLYRFKNAMAVVSHAVPIDGRSAYITVTDIGNGQRTLSSLASTSNYYKRIEATITIATNVSFHYGIQSGNGGFTLANQSSITGDVYSEGSIIGSPNTIYGNVISTGATGFVAGIHATGTIYSHTIGSSSQAATVADQDAYYQVISANTTVTGISHPGSGDQATTSLPIPDSVITKWESIAASGTVISSSWCDTFISNVCTITSDRTIATTTFPFDLVVKGTGNGVTLTVSGPVWVKGSITVTSKGAMQMAPSLGSNNVPIIADNPLNSTSSSIINPQQGAVFNGSGSVGSYVFIISQNRSAETGGSTPAVEMVQGSSALVVYASHGLVSLKQSTDVVSITGYKVALENTAHISYDPNLLNVTFTSGVIQEYSLLSLGEI